MPKSIVLKPDTLLAEDRIRFTDIPVNIYSKTIEEERSVFAPQDFLAIWQDMAAIREFETILSEIKTKRLYKGVAYDHLGPAHLSIGQEASAVGMAFLLTPDDHIYGSHRSHGEILAKGFSAIRKTDEQTLLEVMRTYLDGAILRPLEKDHRGSVADLAIKFVLFGAFSEIFAKETGFNRGMGGSMHAFFTPFGSYPNNAIVGGSGSIAPGAALFKRVNRKRGIIVANIGDASFGCGPVWEGLTFASMDQYRTLWNPELGGGLPILFNCMNNQYGMGGQPLGETMGCRFIARIGAAVNPDSAGRSSSSRRAGVRPCSTPSRTASAGIHPRTPPATGQKRKSRPGSRRIRFCRSGTGWCVGASSRTARWTTHARASSRSSSRCSSSPSIRKPLHGSASIRTWSAASCSPTAGWRNATTGSLSCSRTGRRTRGCSRSRAGSEPRSSTASRCRR
jgi:TPP-dependent pyruvate/acetoin dehydrogenase alpha subunit